MKLLVISVIMVCGISVFAKGGSDVGGGKGVVCRNPDQSIKSVEVLDLWEARVLYGLEIQKPSSNTEDISESIEDYAEKIADVLNIPQQGNSAIPFKLYLNTIAQTIVNEGNSSIQRLHGVNLTLTPDSYEAAFPAGCGVEQIVRYKEWILPGGQGIAAEAQINQDLFEKLDITNRIALALHEGLYNNLRTFSLENSSVRTRRAVGYLLSGRSFTPLAQLLLRPHITCVSSEPYDLDKTVVHIVQGKNPLGTNIVVERFDGALGMGFSENNNWGKSIELEWRRLSKKGLSEDLTTQGPTALNTFSPTDFDILFEVKPAGPKKILVTKKQSFGGNLASVSKVLKCQLNPQD
ncbi:hypothetical protein ACLVWU_08370 [Bdellovibrio sp. HCB290]|uniref:hypothetical protein n=1 Tax=Bdellovibrio sp. HCB290 TaxID=3394356 RepID=UPI0039B664BC